MKIILDTNALIRFFTNDIPEKSQQVRKILENEKQIIIPDVVFPELEYVLRDFYQIDKIRIISIFRFLTSLSAVKLPPHIHRAVDIFESSKLDMADSIIAAQSEKGRLASFDADLLKLDKVESYWK